MLETIISILSGQLGVPEDMIGEESELLKDLGCDSLDLIETVMAIEDAFNIEIPESDYDRLTSVSEICRYVRSAIDGENNLSGETEI